MNTPVSSETSETYDEQMRSNGSGTESCDGEEVVIEREETKITGLNEKYQTSALTRFKLFFNTAYF